jgi:hypothetical protein
MSRFGSGQVAATALRGRVLERLGAEPEWTDGDHDDKFVCWTAGPATTFFCVEDGPDGAPDLGVFRVFTPVATVGDAAAALTRCNTLNSYATTNRWMIAPGSYEDAAAEMIWIGCSFVVGPHNQAALETFVTWCVQEQIATATAGMTSGLAEQLGGKPCLLENEDDRHREETAWNEVVRHYQNMVEPSKNKRADDLAIKLQGAFLSLRDEMLAEGKGAWYSPEPDSYPLSCEMPANWSGYAQDIRWMPDQGGPPTALIEASLTAWGDLGNGLLITMSPPGHADSDDVANQLNRLDEQARGATHFVGAWMRHQHDLIYLVFLPAALLEQDITWPVVMREILLTFARQAQLARRVVIEPDIQRMLDGGGVQPAGLEASLRPHGLAWGETGEGRNPAASYLDGIYRLLVGDDTDWACPAANGFTWWPYQQAQEISVIPPDDAPAPLREPVVIRISTEVRTAVPVAPQSLTAIAKRNASLAGSALVLRDDGTLVLTCQLALDEGFSAQAPQWAQDLAIRQFVTARELGAELTGLGTDAASAQPVSGPRPEPDWWFGEFEREAHEAAAASPDEAGTHPQVPLIAAGGLYALPYRMSSRDDGTLEFTWRPSHTPWPVPADPEIQVTVARGADAADPAWIIRSHVSVTAREAEMARWCNDRNAGLLLAPDPPMVMVTGGWGLTTAGECCLTTGQPRRLVPDDEAEAWRSLGHLLREAQHAVIAALRTAPEAVRGTPLTAVELAAGLDTVRAAFARLFGDSQEAAWSAEPGEARVLVTCGEMTMEVPVGYGRPQLALLYGELLASFPSGRSWLSLSPVFPARVAGLVFENLERDGSLWQDEAGNWVFDAGRGQAQLELTQMGQALRVDGIAEFLAANRISGIPVGPGIGRLGVTIPPAPFAWAVEYTAVEVLEWVVRQVIARVREAARLGELSRKPAPPERPRLFGSGRYAAAALRARLLELLGAEPEWMTGDHDCPGIVWSSGLATTMFEVTAGADGTPDVGGLRVYTPVAAARNGNTARDVCSELNASTATARWSVVRERDPDGTCYDEVQLQCAFVVGPGNQDLLESFALWCVREQIAVATGHIRAGDVAAAVSGVCSRYTGFPAGDERPGWHPVTSFIDRVVLPSASLSADGLADELQEAFRGLRDTMVGERTSAWFAAEDTPPLTCETPFAWEPYPDGVITHMRVSDDDPGDKPPTALLESELTKHPEFGNGLRITIHVPRDPRGHSGRAINELNRLDTKVAGASHSFGGWTISQAVSGDGTSPGCEIFLPAAFAESVANRRYVMREILLTLARQALLARRVLLPADERSAGDCGPGIGLAVAADPLAAFARGPHGLAWGETGEGRNPAARVLDQIYAKCVGPDADWADTRTDGFTWWPYQQAQDITATLRSASDVTQGVSVRISTEVRRRVPATTETLRVVAAMNTELGQSALVLRRDGLLFLACRLYAHEGIDRWAPEWAKNLAAEQFIAAREISAKLAELGGFGEDAVSGHPFSGVRPDPDELFGIRENYLIEAATGVQAGLAPLVPLLGLCRLYALPTGMSVTGPGGGLDFTWHVSQSRSDLPVDAAARVSVRRGDAGSGPGWIIRSVVPLAGDETARARWCNDRNLDLLADGDDSGGDQTFVGGWGLTPAGECCLTTWLSPFFVPDAIPQAAGLVGNVLSYHAGAALTAVAADPGAVTGAPNLTPEELARGLSSVLATYAETLEYPAGFRWSAVPGTDGAVVTLTGSAARTGQADGVTLAEAGDSGLRTVLRIPPTRNRAQLGLLYAAFLGRSMTRVKTSTEEMIPGEAREWDFTIRHIEDGLGPLEDEGLLEWHRPELAFTFDAGPAEAWLRFRRLEDFRSYGGTALRLTATIPGLDLAALQNNRAGDADVAGSWRADAAGLSYEVTIPPAGMIFGNDIIAGETVTWIGRHIVTHVRNALSGGTRVTVDHSEAMPS